MTTYLTTSQVISKARITRQWFQKHHLKNQYLKPAAVPGAHGHRFAESDVMRWLAKYYPEHAQPQSA